MLATREADPKGKPISGFRFARRLSQGSPGLNGTGWFTGPWRKSLREVCMPWRFLRRAHRRRGRGEPIQGATALIWAAEAFRALRGVIRREVIWLRRLRRTSKRKPWKV